MPEETTNLITLLQSDHHRIEELFSRLDALAESAMEAYFCELREELVRHEVAEELVVYPAVRDNVPGGNAIADARIGEQAKAEDALARLEKEDTTTLSFRTQLFELRRNVLAHAGREETEVFTGLEAALSPMTLSELGAKYARALKAAPTHPHPHAPDTPPGNMIVGPIASLVDHLRDAMRGAA